MRKEVPQAQGSALPKGAHMLDVLCGRGCNRAPSRPQAPHRTRVTCLTLHSAPCPNPRASCPNQVELEGLDAAGAAALAHGRSGYGLTSPAADALPVHLQVCGVCAGVCARVCASACACVGKHVRVVT